MTYNATDGFTVNYTSNAAIASGVTRTISLYKDGGLVTTATSTTSGVPANTAWTTKVAYSASGNATGTYSVTITFTDANNNVVATGTGSVYVA